MPNIPHHTSPLLCFMLQTCFLYHEPEYRPSANGEGMFSPEIWSSSDFSFCLSWTSRVWYGLGAKNKFSVQEVLFLSCSRNGIMGLLTQSLVVLVFIFPVGQSNFSLLPGQVMKALSKPCYGLWNCTCTSLPYPQAHRNMPWEPRSLSGRHLLISVILL